MILKLVLRSSGFCCSGVINQHVCHFPTLMMKLISLTARMYRMYYKLSFFLEPPGIYRRRRNIWNSAAQIEFQCFTNWYKAINHAISRVRCTLIAQTKLKHIVWLVFEEGEKMVWFWWKKILWIYKSAHLLLRTYGQKKSNPHLCG